MPKSILIFAYYSFRDPVFQSAVLPYFINFPEKEKFHFVLLTFEQSRYTLTSAERKVVQQELAEHNITWHARKWHSGRFKPIKKLYDLSTGLAVTLKLIRKYKVAAIYSEGFPGAIIAHFAAKLTKRPHIVHSFEPHGDYMVESGVWAPTSWEAKVQWHFENVVAKNAYAILTATNAMIEKLRPETEARLYRVPSCVDLDHFKFRPEARVKLRKEHNIAEEDVVIVYLGKLGGMYVKNELIEFFNAFLKASDDFSFRFMVLTPQDINEVIKLIDEYKIPKSIFLIKNLTRLEVPDYLSAADIAFCGIRPIYSRRFSSPIKNGEYWACGLPVIIPEGISDTYSIVEQNKIGWRLPSLSQKDMITTAKRVCTEWGLSKRQEYQIVTREYVTKDRSVSVYRQLYQLIFSQL